MTYSMRLLIILLIIFVALVLGVFHTTSAKLNTSQISNKNDLLEQWKEMDKTVTKMTGSAIKMILPEIIDSASQLNISAQCITQSIQLISGIRRLKMWAFKFVDSSSKVIDGMLTGSSTSVGKYDQCLVATAESKDPNKPLFRGQYCQINIVPPLPPKTRRYKFGERMEELENFTGSEVVNFMAERAGLFHSFPYKMGLCVPSGCNANEIDQFVKAIADKMYWKTSVNFCEVKEDVQFSAIAIVAIVICVFISIIVLIGTCFEFISKKMEVVFENISCKLLMRFSMISNFKSLFSTKSPVANLKCLNGIKFMTITMVVMGHSYLYPVAMLNIYQSLLLVYDIMKTPMSQMIMNTNVVIDTFFFISGLLICYREVTNEKINNRKLNLRVFVLHKLWRIVPVYYFILLIYMLTPLMGSGPNFKETMKFSVDNCYKHWWTNLLFINNFVNFNEMCMIHTWYIACDFQLYLSTLIVLLPILRSQTVGVMISLVIISISVMYTGLITYFHNLTPGLYVIYLDKDFVADTFLKTYGNPITHSGPYFIGVLLGYALVMKPDIKISRKHQTIGWILAILCSAYTLFWTTLWQHYTPGIIETSIYGGLYRSTWILGVAWMTFCCVTGHGGFINSFLNWSPWTPLARLSLLIYLIQPTLQTIYIGIFKSTHEFNHFELVVIYFGLLLMSGFLAFLCNLLIESPLVAIEKLIFGKKDTSNVELDTTVGKRTDENLNTENKIEIELNSFSNGIDNRAFNRISLNH